MPATLLPVPQKCASKFDIVCETVCNALGDQDVFDINASDTTKALHFKQAYLELDKTARVDTNGACNDKIHAQSASESVYGSSKASVRESWTPELSKSYHAARKALNRRNSLVGRFSAAVSALVRRKKCAPAPPEVDGTGEFVAKLRTALAARKDASGHRNAE